MQETITFFKRNFLALLLSLTLFKRGLPALFLFKRGFPALLLFKRGLPALFLFKRGFLALLLFFTLLNPLYSKPEVIQLSGIIVGATDTLAVPFATVLIQGTSQGTVSDFNGFFSLVVTSGQTLLFSSIGYVPVSYTIPDTVSADAYSIVQSMAQDTYMLPTTFIYPWPSKDDFREAFINLKLPETQEDILKRNFSLAKIRELARNTRMDAGQNYSAMVREVTDKLYYKGQLSPPNNLLNPFAWAAFIRDWKRQKDAKKIETQKKEFEIYGDDDYIPPPPPKSEKDSSEDEDF
ncbi:MAG: carboxypeptidase-like regulatory domain-containing protein [Bacteroidales bacterium]|jgi:hypothetical protein|nr:carboxypeptidase-like regulatory domain-containing protein [Bacteroidales bacterium]